MKTGVSLWDVAVGLSVPVGVYLLFVVANFLRKYFRDIRTALQFPCPPFHWLYGNFHLVGDQFGDKYLSMIRDTVEKNPRSHVLWMPGFFPMINLTHPVPVKQLLKAQTKKSEIDYEPIKPWLGNGLVMSEGAIWKVHRRLLTPAFHFDILKQYVSVYNTAAGEMIEKLSEYGGKEESFEVFQQASLTTMEVILQCAFSGGGMTEQTKNEYLGAVQKIGDLVTEAYFNTVYTMFPSIYRMSPGGREFLRLCDFVHDVAYSIIKKRREELERDPEILAEKKRLDFIDILLTARDEDGRGLTDQEIREQVDTFLFAGHDTTSSTLCWTLYSLAQHPQHQEKVQQEVEELLSGRDDDTIKWEDLNKLTYLTMCVKESLRLHGTVPLISRTTTEDTVIDGIPIPKDTYVGINIYALNHNPDVWGPDHMEFDPNRFQPDRIKEMDSHAFMPFSAGPRNCIGQAFALNEEKVLLARLLNKFTFELDPTHPVVKDFSTVLKTKDGMWMKVKTRETVG
ncbi:cytochrome P450 4F4-like [Branchiostoma floridae]|uniref:Cytochrome P450 4F4-like n=1 Tax=Branchiostoma floridae TaxID=7739 RepID=A0A9J7LIG2_BRAFL|nr:cytochrome P450 4F4-like [Branchiostoma floridae]XP_035683438.1 cytochrome P450 4F4-like [Branchiostoma floridae]